MARKVEDPLDAIKADIEQRFQVACVNMAANTTYLIESAYETAIQSFYDDYTPRYYKRTYSTYLASDKYNDPFGFTPLGDSMYESGIIVDHENIPGSPYRADKHWVFTRTFDEGIHGYFKWEMERWRKNIWKNANRKYVMSSARKKRLADFLDKSLKHSPKKYTGPKRNKVVIANKNNSSIRPNVWSDTAYYERFDESIASDMIYKEVSVSGWFSSSPKQHMDKMFKDLTKKRTMDAMFSKCLESAFSK